MLLCPTCWPPSLPLLSHAAPCGPAPRRTAGQARARQGTAGQGGVRRGRQRQSRERQGGTGSGAAGRGGAKQGAWGTRVLSHPYRIHVWPDNLLLLHHTCWAAFMACVRLLCAVCWMRAAVPVCLPPCFVPSLGGLSLHAPGPHLMKQPKQPCLLESP
jgi:hypothetical protein